jgi:hypothetical protein
MIWIDNGGNIFGNGRSKPGDRLALPAETLAFYTALRASVVDFVSLPKVDRALLLAAAAMAGKTAGESEVAFNEARGDL